MKKLAIVISHPIQHFSPMCRALAAENDIDLKVFFCCDWGVNNYSDPGFGHNFKWDIPLTEGYEHEFLKIRKRPDALSFFQINNPEVTRSLEGFNPDWVWIHGYASMTSLRVWRWCRKQQVKSLYFSDSELLHDRRGHTRLLKKLLLPYFFKHISACLTIGDENERYYKEYGVPQKKYFRGSFPVEVNRFSQAVQEMTSDKKSAIFQKHGLKPERFTVLFIGKFIGIKRPFDLVDAIALLKGKTVEVQALFIGSGPLENEIREEIQINQLSDRVAVTGFVNQKEIPDHLACGDALAMCSEVDPHPLAVTEAMATGNVIIASDKIGCVGPTDAARPGENTLVYPCGDIENLASHILYLLENPEQCQRMKEKSKELAWTQDVRVAVEGVKKALCEVE